MQNVLYVCLFVSLKLWADPGFHLPNDPHIPSGVKASAGSVFQVRFPVAPTFEPNSSYGRKLLSNFKEEMSKNKKSDYRWLGGQIRSCIKNPSQPCTIYENGTAFIAQSQQTLWTALRNIDLYLLAESSELGLNLEDGINESEMTIIKGLKIPIVISEASGDTDGVRILFGQNPDEYAQVDRLDSLFTSRKISVIDRPWFTDYVRLKLSRPLVGYRPLGFAESNSAELGTGETVFIAGYPIKTTDRRHFNAPDSDGHSLRISFGPISDVDAASKRWGLDLNALPTKLQDLIRHIELHIAGDCVRGANGGPVFDKRGRVIALFSHSNPVNDSHYIPEGRDCLAMRSSNLLNGTVISLD